MNKQDRLIKNLIIIVAILIIIYLIGQMEYIHIPIGKVLTIVLSPIVFASFFYYLFRPFVKLFDKRNVSRRISVVAVLLGFVLILSLIIYFGGNIISNEFAGFFETFTKELDSLRQSVEEFISDNNWADSYSLEDAFGRLMETFEGSFLQIGRFTSGWYSNISDFGTILILIPILLFFLLKDDKYFYKSFMSFVPEKHRDNLSSVLKEIDELLSIYFISQLIVAFVFGIVTYIGYLIIGLPNALSLALIAMLLSIIPFIGPIIAAIPAFLIALTHGFQMVIKLMIVLAVSQLIDGNVSRPNVMGTRLNIHPMLVIVVVILGISMFGFIGAFFAIPFYGVVRIIVKNLILINEES